MTRFAPIAFTLALAALLATTLAPPVVAQSQDIMQCMEKCLRAEGKDQKDMCKLRCADVPMVTRPGGPPGQQDCMGHYKACTKDCGKDRDCQKACKATLMGCK